MNKREIRRMAKDYVECNLGELRDYGEKTDDGEVIESLYLGSLINPSGKYYMPWACSNVKPCPKCGGTGDSKKSEKCPNCPDGRRSITALAISRQDTHEHIISQIKSGEILAEDYRDSDRTFKCLLCNGTGKVHQSCSYCGGCGSREAHEDELFWEFLEHYADKHGCFIQSGEGDPCDTFLCRVKETDESENSD